VTAPLRVNVTLPVTRLGVGPFSFDPLEQLIGARVTDLLRPLLAGPVVRRASASGAAVEVYPLALPDGEGATIPLGHWGELGFRNDAGTLVLTVPWAMAAWLQERLGDARVRGPEPVAALEGGARVAQVWVRPRPGTRATLPLGAIGECGLEAP
jgi:hypothetical protein